MGPFIEVLNNTNKKVVICVISIVLLNSCLDPIDIDVSADNVPRLVVDGQFNDSGEQQVLRLSQSLSFGERLLSPIVGATIQLCDLGLNICEQYNETEAGLYTLDPIELIPSEGHQYYVQINLEDGNQYESIVQEMPATQKADSAYFRFERKNIIDKFGVERVTDIVNIFIDSPIEEKNGTVYIRWSYDELYIFPEELCNPLDRTLICYVPIKGDPQNITLLSSDILDLDRIDGINVGLKDNFPLQEFKSRHYFNVYQYSINQDAFTYWSRVKSIISQAGTVFDIPPASIPGNIVNVNDPEDQVLGFFEVASRDVQRTFMFPSEFKKNISFFDYCSFTENRFRWPAACCDCLSNLPDASLERPNWIK